MSPTKRLTRVMVVTLLLACLLPLSSLADAAETVQQDIEQLLRTDKLAIDGVHILTQETLLEIYADNGFNPYWINHEKINELLQLINDSASHGLSPSDYNIEQLSRILSRQKASPTAEIDAETDILLMESLIRYGYHRRYGKVKANTLDPDINFKREKFKHQGAPKTIEEMLNSSSPLAGLIEMLAPTGPVYRHLQDSIRQYRNIANNGGWPSVPEGPTLRQGDNDKRVTAIRKRLAVGGHMSQQTDPESSLFDKPLQDAVKAFQERHLLDPDGVVGKQTIETLNIPVEHRIDQLRLSLERLRWVRQEESETMVVVNIAGFRALYYSDHKLQWETPVMVGKNYRQTPVFTGDIAYLEFNPTWTIPPGILRKDILPKVSKDPNYLASKEIRLIDNKGKTVDPLTVDWSKHTRSAPYTFRQDPGPHNALGMVKFIFPNSHFVFLHDTPHRELFSKQQRDFSSGCVRVKDPFKLAELILDDPVKYSRSEIEAIVDSRETIRIKPGDRVPVIIIYLTASVNSDGKTRFFRDIYARDQRVLDALNGAVIIQAPKA